MGLHRRCESRRAHGGAAVGWLLGAGTARRRRHSRLPDACRPRRAARRDAARLSSTYGRNSPCLRKSVFGLVAASPSAPPSLTWICPICHTARLPAATAPGMTEFTDVVTAQVEPIAGSAVATHGTVNGKLVSASVPVSAPDGPFARSVIRSDWSARSSPV